MFKQLLYIMVVLFLLFSGTIVLAQTEDGVCTQIHEISIIVVPTNKPISWVSPASLYKSMLSNYFNSLLIKNHYLLGHLAVMINSPLLSDTIFTGMVAENRIEQTKMFFKDKIGLGILGATMKGKLESKDELQHKLKSYRQNNNLAYITFRVNDIALNKMLTFIELFSAPLGTNSAACNYYGGSFWPLYAHEGAGCSAFGLALLDLVNIMPDEAQEWQVRVNIPMSLIGGDFNKGKKVKLREIRNTKEWSSGNGLENVDYVPFKIYDPSLIYNWIIKQRTSANSRFQHVVKNKIHGLFIDCRDVWVDEHSPVFITREKSNFFVDFYSEKLETIEVVKSN